MIYQSKELEFIRLSHNMKHKGELFIIGLLVQWIGIHKVVV